MDFFDVVKNLGSLLTLILSGVSFAGIMTKFLHKRYDRMFDEHLEEIRKNDKKQAEEITEIKDTLNKLTTKVDHNCFDEIVRYKFYKENLPFFSRTTEFFEFCYTYNKCPL